MLGDLQHLADVIHQFRRHSDLGHVTEAFVAHALRGGQPCCWPGEMVAERAGEVGRELEDGGSGREREGEKEEGPEGGGG